MESSAWGGDIPLRDLPAFPAHYRSSMPLTPLTGRLLAVLFTIRLAVAADPGAFELHAVADPTTKQGIGYPFPQPKGPPEMVMLDSTVLMDHTALKSVELKHEPDGEPTILLTFTEAGARRFTEITTQYLGKQLGVILEGQLHSATRVGATIRGGSLTLTRFTEAEAADLVQKLQQSIVR